MTGELHEEWFITDYEEFVNLGEYPSLEDIEKAARLTSEYGWEAVAEYYGYNQSLDDFEEAYQGDMGVRGRLRVPARSRHIY